MENTYKWISMNITGEKVTGDRRSRYSISSDSCSEGDEEHYYCKTNVLKHKTELCKTFSELGYCNYGQKCRFAHGKHELVSLPTKEHFRKRKCNGFWKTGCCLYGIRCQFGHAFVEWENKATLAGIQAQCVEETFQQSRLLKLLG